MNRHIFCALLLCLTFCLTACVNEVEPIPMGEDGRLQLSLANINTATTRTSPADLGKPSVANFQLQIVNAAGRIVFNDIFTEDIITLPTGRYDVIVSHGHNAQLSIDAPYYIGTRNVEIRKDETTQASITARVGNALVSVRFGKDAEEQARFERYYSDYAMHVYLGNNYLTIDKQSPSSSVYVQAGSHVTLKFWGKLKMENDREVSINLESSDFPSVLNAADHAIVTLSLPDPESALGVDISKVEVETVNLDETIPLSWLPAAVTVPQHQYDKEGNLVGTNLLIADAFPGQKWRAVITNQAGTIVRSVEGTGSLESRYNSTANASTWPYLPQGQYNAKYYTFDDENHASYQNSRDFTIQPPKLNITVDGYTSYDKYIAGDIDGANACDRITIYEPVVKVNVSTTLLNNNNISKSFTYTFDGTTTDVTTGNTYAPGDMTDQKVSMSTHVLRGDLTFDGVSVSAQKEFRITGLPANFEPPSEGTGWSNDKGTTDFESEYVRLGNYSWSQPHRIKNTTWLCLPKGLVLQLDYDIALHRAAVNTSANVKIGDQQIVEVTESSYGKDIHNMGTATVTTSADVSTITCEGSYGSGATHTKVYKLNFKYGR